MLKKSPQKSLHYADPLEILRREHQLIQRQLSELDEMTYSVSVNVRDLSFSFKEVLRLLESHEYKEELVFEALKEAKIEFPVENLKIKYGEFKEKCDIVLAALGRGEDEEVKSVLYGACAELIDRIKAHIFAEKEVFDKIPWNKLDKKTLEKIELLQIIPNRRLL